MLQHERCMLLQPPPLVITSGPLLLVLLSLHVHTWAIQLWFDPSWLWLLLVFSILSLPQWFVSFFTWVVLSFSWTLCFYFPCFFDLCYDSLALILLGNKLMVSAVLSLLICIVTHKLLDALVFALYLLLSKPLPQTVAIQLTARNRRVYWCSAT